MPDKKSNRGSESSITVGTVVAKRWIVEECLGKGGFGSVFGVLDTKTNEKCAMKVDKKATMSSKLITEAFILHKLSESRHICRFIDLGHIGGLHYLVMSKTGHNLATLRRMTPERKFSLGVVMRIALECAEGLKDLHDIGFIHRDVKPSNFAIGNRPNEQSTVILLDFGLSFQFRMLQFRQNAVENMYFHGTYRYASCNAHYKRMLGMHDDFLSLLYMLAEMYLDRLPWTGRESKCVIGSLKRRVSTVELFSHMPEQIHQLYKALMRMEYENPLNHSVVFELLEEAAKLTNAPKQLSFDLLQIGNNEDALPLSSKSLSTAQCQSEKEHKKTTKKSLSEAMTKL